ncbi:MAG: hypothetical protein KA871_00285 [Cloacibacterium sp.]|nr:hypothetical protein [Cloacibacterium sp.]
MSKKIKIFFFFLLSVLAFAQTLSSNLSKEKIALGEKATLRISINNLRGRDVISKPKNELLPFHFEETKDDITKTFDNYSRTIEFQIFDEGKYTIPPLEFSINGEVLKTIPYEITVYNPVNADEQISDIMNNKQVELGWKDYWEMYKWYVLGAFIVIALLFVFLGMFKNGVFGKNNKEKPSIHKTLLDLKNLEKKKYAENGNFRMFYVELIDITRDFLTKQYRIPADVLLTDDLIDLMKHTNKISTENEKVVEEIFLRGDLVKFAKAFPTKELMQKDFGEIYDFVERSTVDIEAEHLREVN